MKRNIVLLILAVLFTVFSSCNNTKLTIDQAIQAFRDAGLECENPQPVATNDDSPLPKTFLAAQRCVVPSVDSDHGLRVFEFDNDKDLKMVKDYYEGFSGIFGSYVYVRDNLLFQTSVSMPKDLSIKYQEVFISFQP